MLWTASQPLRGVARLPNAPEYPGHMSCVTNSVIKSKIHPGHDLMQHLAAYSSQQTANTFGMHHLPITATTTTSDLESS